MSCLRTPWLFLAVAACAALSILLPQASPRASAQTIHDVPPPDPLHFFGDATFLYGRVSGFLQIPSGGVRGTTGRDRPRLGEIGIHDAPIGDFSVGADFNLNQLYAGGQIIDLTGSTTLSNGLVSHGVVFPAGTHVSSTVDLNWVKFGYRRAFPLGDSDFTLLPSAGGDLLLFDYRLRGSGVGDASRNFTHVGPQLGLEVDWRPNQGPFTLSAGAAGFPLITGIPSINVASAIGNWRFVDTPQFTFDAYVGVQWEEIWFKDSQRVSNHISAEFWPTGLVGVRLRF